MATQDNTNAAGAQTGEPFDTAGPGSIHWVQDDQWGTLAVNGVTAYWVHAEVLSVSGPVAPVQQNRHPYTIAWPFVEIRSDKAGGDVPGLVRFKIRNQTTGGAFAPSVPSVLSSDRWILGLRSLSRGEDFRAYLNASDEQNPSGITFASGTNTTVITDPSMPTGRVASFAPGAATAWTEELWWILDSTIDDQYYGTFHAFLRVLKTSSTAADTIGARLYCTALDSASSADATYSSRTAYVQSVTTADDELLDLGRITTPPGKVLSTEDANGLRFYVELMNTDASDEMRILDLILIPVDEMSVDTFEIESDGLGSSMNLDYTTLLDLDSVTNVKWTKRSVRRVVATDRIFGSYALIGPDELIIQAHADQRVWFLSAYYQTLAGFRTPLPEIAHSVQMWNVSRYFNLRGNR
jgi:hypothetical protein